MERTNSFRDFDKEAVKQQIHQDFRVSLCHCSEPLQEEFSKMVDTQLEILSVESADAFANGFSLGARLMLEAMQAR